MKDEEIAAQMTQEGFHSARLSSVSASTVLKVRLRHHWQQTPESSRRYVQSEPGYWSVRDLAAHLKCDAHWVYRHIETGRIDPAYLKRCSPRNAYLIQDDPSLLASLREERSQVEALGQRRPELRKRGNNFLRFYQRQKLTNTKMLLKSRSMNSGSSHSSLLKNNADISDVQGGISMDGLKPIRAWLWTPKWCSSGYSVQFVVAQHLANTVVAATTRTELTHLIDSLIACDLLILDEFGYLTLDPKVGPVLYEIIAARYEKGATIITSNKSLAAWGELVGDNALMMAVIDRLLHHGEVFYLRGSSYRMRGKEAVALAPAHAFAYRVFPFERCYHPCANRSKHGSAHVGNETTFPITLLAMAPRGFLLPGDDARDRLA
jgi:IstB-like ATP binding protein